MIIKPSSFHILNNPTAVANPHSFLFQPTVAVPKEQVERAAALENASSLTLAEFIGSSSNVSLKRMATRALKTTSTALIA